MTNYPFLGPMKLIPITAAAGLAGLSLLLSAQTPQPPQWSGALEGYQASTYVQDLACSGGRVYGVQSFSVRTHLYSLSPDGKAESKELALPHQRKHSAFSAFTLIGGKPCVVYNTWDKKTGVLQLSLQAYSPELEPEGAPVAMGSIPLNHKTYDGSAIWLRAERSADGTKTVIYFDEIQQGEIKIGMYWVVGEDRDLLWSGAYRIPVAAVGSETKTWVANNGHVYVRVTAIGLEDLKVKEKKDGTPALRVQLAPWRKMKTAWYEMFGKTFNKWEPDTQDGQVNWDLSFANHGSTNLLAGMRTTGSRNEITSEWVVFHLEDGLHPTMAAQGPARQAPNEAGKKPNAMVDEAGNVYVSMLYVEGTYLARIDKGGGLAWEKMLAWQEPHFFLYKGQVFSLGAISKQRVVDVLDGKPFKTDRSYPNQPELPMGMAVSPGDGQVKPIPLMPKDENRNYASWNLSPATIVDCGRLAILSNKTKGFVSVDLLD